MSVLVVGIDHEQAPLDVLERVTMGDAEAAKSLADLRAWPNVEEAVVLSTCLRTEVYAVADRFHEAVDQICALLGARAASSAAEIQELSTIRFDDDVAVHLFAVAAGLRSAVVGESEVLGQVRRAWELSRDERASGPVLAELFRHAVQSGKRVRSETGVARGSMSFPHAAVELAEGRRAGGLAGADVAVIGAGEMGGGVVRALGALPDGRRPARVVVANRTRDRARQVVAAAPDTLHASAAGLADLDRAIDGAHVVFTALEASGHVVGAGALAGAGVREGGLLVVDLGMPRNVDPAAADAAGVTLLDMEDLRSAVTRVLEDRKSEAARATGIVAEQLARYRAASRERGAAPVVAALRARVEGLRAEEMDRRRAQLDALGDGAFDEVDAATRAVLAKLLHDPSMVLKETAGTSRGERLVEALRALFDL